jgi:hypothetical protein
VQGTEATLIDPDEPDARLRRQGFVPLELPHEGLERVLDGEEAAGRQLHLGQFGHASCKFVGLVDLGCAEALGVRTGP